MSTIPTLSTPGLVEGPELEALIKCLQTLHRKSRFGLGMGLRLCPRSSGARFSNRRSFPGTPASPDEIAAGFVDQKRAEAYWVVLSGREPGLYTTSDEANEQTSRVPHQQQQRVVGFEAALAVYTVHYPQDTKKWVEVPHSDPAIDSLVAPMTRAAFDGNDVAGLD
ncbi:hypothetical protein B0H14DRAFT_2620472 [Mycena olivaceomarginata]|nr:hypothetical protein B0H14DRAFT_2620472 [Mycena olivaceomarginata]